MDSAGRVFRLLTSRLLKLAFVLILIGATPVLAQERYNSNGGATTSSNQGCGPGVFAQGLSPTYEQAEFYANGTWQCPPPQPGDTWLGVNGKTCTYEKPVPCGAGNSAPVAGPGTGAGAGNGSGGGSTGGGNGGSTQTSVEPQLSNPPIIEEPGDSFVTNNPSQPAQSNPGQAVPPVVLVPQVPKLDQGPKPLVGSATIVNMPSEPGKTGPITGSVQTYPGPAQTAQIDWTPFWEKVREGIGKNLPTNSGLAAILHASVQYTIYPNGAVTAQMVSLSTDRRYNAMVLEAVQKLIPPPFPTTKVNGRVVRSLRSSVTSSGDFTNQTGLPHVSGGNSADVENLVFSNGQWQDAQP